MKHRIGLALSAVLFLACQQPKETNKKWSRVKTVTLNGINPIGIAHLDGSTWLSDGDHNRLVRISADGKILETVDSLDRPMHIDASEEVLFVPLYGRDEIFNFHSENPMRQLPAWNYPNDSLDAPAGVSVFGKEKAIADFYNNRILYFDGDDWLSFGKEGKAPGEFYYPTDVQITFEKIWVADAYNNRIQVFDKKGNFLKMMGQDQEMNATTGIYVSENKVFATDFENDRVLVFHMAGDTLQILTERIHKPTDVMVRNDSLYVLNYRRGEMQIFTETSKP